MAPRRKILLWLLPAAGLLVSGVVAWWLAVPAGAVAADVPATQPPADAQEEAATRHAVHVNPGPATPTVRATHGSGAGPAADISCATCHTTRTPDVATRTSAALTEFHQSLDYQHGNLSCLSCHNATNYDTLRHADGTPIAFPDTIQLCAQCHGTHYRDFQHGSHGGMTGHWDLTAGPRQRNTCVDCHDAHRPIYPRVRPVFPPQDRGARQQRARAATETSPHE